MTTAVNNAPLTLNVLSGSTIAELNAQIAYIQNNAATPALAVLAIQKLYADLHQEACLDLAALSDQTKVQAALTALAPVAALTIAGGNSQDYFTANKTSILSALTALSTQINSSSITRRVNTSDMVFYQYSRAGEAGLNIQLGQLGDAIDSLNKAVTQLNRVEYVMSINPGQNLLNYRGELMSYSNSNPTTATADKATGVSSSLYYYNVVPAFSQTELVSGSTTSYNNAIQVLKDTMIQLNAVQNLFPAGSDQYQALQTVLTQMNTYGISGWSGTQSNWFDTTAPNPTNGDGFYNNSTPTPKNFARLFMDDVFRKAVSDALATAQSQSDVQQQNLRKAQFLYQEFVKSAGDIMDRIYQAMQNVIQKIAQ